MENIDEIKRRLKNRNKKIWTKTNELILSRQTLYRQVVKILIVVVLVLITLIAIKTSTKREDFIYQHLFNTNLKFAQINHYYKKYLGNILPFQNVISEDEPVFKEQLTFNEMSKYHNGAKLMVATDYLIPIVESGIVVFIGEKENYGNTIIIQQTNGLDLWYGNIKNSNVQIYEYVEKGKLLGEVAGDTLYLVFQKEGQYLDYKNYLK